MSDVIGKDKFDRVDRVAEARERALSAKETLEKNAEVARVDGVKHRIEEFYWDHLGSIFLNDIECPIRRVLATGGAMNVHTGRGELKAWGGDFIVTMPDGTDCVFSRESVRQIDQASNAAHVDPESGEVIPVPFGYPDFDESLLELADDLDTDRDNDGDVDSGDLPPVPYQGPHQPQGGPASRDRKEETEPTLSELQKSDKRKFEEDQKRASEKTQREAAKDERKSVTLESPRDPKRSGSN